jgi:hypothetical protein
MIAHQCGKNKAAKFARLRRFSVKLNRMATSGMMLFQKLILVLPEDALK